MRSLWVYLLIYIPNTTSSKLLTASGRYTRMEGFWTSKRVSRTPLLE